MTAPSTFMAAPRPATGGGGGLRFAREAALLDKLQQEIRLIERQLRVQKGQTQFLSLRYSKRMVVITNVVLGVCTFFSEFALQWRSLNRQRALAAWRAHRHGWVWSPGMLLNSMGDKMVGPACTLPRNMI